MENARVPPTQATPITIQVTQSLTTPLWKRRIGRTKPVPGSWLPGDALAAVALPGGLDQV